MSFFFLYNSEQFFNFSFPFFFSVPVVNIIRFIIYVFVIILLYYLFNHYCVLQPHSCDHLNFNH